MYKLIKNAMMTESTVVFDTERNFYIPFDSDNSDYQEYLKWVSAGNEPLPADE